MNKRTGLYLAVKGESGLVKKNEREGKKNDCKRENWKKLKEIGFDNEIYSRINSWLNTNHFQRKKRLK